MEAKDTLLQNRSPIGKQAGSWGNFKEDCKGPLGFKQHLSKGFQVLSFERGH